MAGPIPAHTTNLVVTLPLLTHPAKAKLEKGKMRQSSSIYVK